MLENKGVGLEEVYKKLTSIDIEEQKRIWDERAKGYYGEYLVFTELYQRVQGQCKILMNLNVPSSSEKTTEIDLLMVHESGIYVFEVKHYKGTIYGNYRDENWTQYFRTQPNSHFHSPIKQNEYHIEALRKLLVGFPIYSFVVFTNPDTELKVSGQENSSVVVCRLNELNWHIDRINAAPEKQFTGEQIDELFSMLSRYSPMSSKEATVDGEVIPFDQYINQIRDDYRAELIKTQKEERKRYIRKNTAVIGIALIVCAVILAVSSMFVLAARKKSNAALQEKENAEKELAEFSKKFKRAEPLNGGEIALEDDFVAVDDVVLEKSADLKDVYLFTCKLKVNGKEYGIGINANTCIIVQMKDGSVTEYVWKDIEGAIPFTYVGPFLGYYDEMQLPEIRINVKNADDIAGIKLINIMICSKDATQKDILPGTEFELYPSK